MNAADFGIGDILDIALIDEGLREEDNDPQDGYLMFDPCFDCMEQ